MLPLELSAAKKSNKAKKKAPLVQKEWYAAIGWGHERVVAGAGYTWDLSSGGMWRFESSFITAVGDKTLGAQTNNYSVNGLLTFNVDLFSRLRFTIKGGPAIRHRGLGVEAANEYYNYGAAIALDLDSRGSYGIYYYPDMIGFAYIKRFK